MGLEDTPSGRQARFRDIAEIHPGHVVLASSALPDVRRPQRRPYLAIFCKQKNVISLPLTSLRLSGSFDDACRSREREPDTYYPIAPNENGGIYDAIKMLHGPFSGYIDLLCPITLGKHTIEWSENVGWVSDEDLRKIIDAHKGLLWDGEKVLHNQTTIPPVDLAFPETLSLSRSGSPRNLSKNTLRRPPPIHRARDRYSPEYRGEGKDRGGDKDPRGRILQGYRKTSPQNINRRHKRKRQYSGENSLKRTRHLGPDSRDTILSSENYREREHLDDGLMKPAEGDRNRKVGASEDTSTLSPRSAKSWVWSGTSSEAEAAPETLGEEIGQEDVAGPNMPPNPRALSMILGLDGRALPSYRNNLTRCLDAGHRFDSLNFTDLGTASAGASNTPPNLGGDKRPVFSHHYSVQQYPPFS